MEYKNYNKRPNKKNYMGYVTRWNKRGYGFVRCYDDGEAYYCSKKVINGEPYLTTPIDISGSRLAQGGSSVTRQAVFALPQDFTEYLIAFGDGQIAYYSGQ